MDLSQAFSFGRVLKTILPGLVVVLAFVLGVDALETARAPATPHVVLHWIMENSGAASLIGIPLIILGGVLLNTLFFVWLSEVLVKRRCLREHPGLRKAESDLKEVLKERICSEGSRFEKCWRSVDTQGIDLLFIFLPEATLDHTMYAKDRYWYYYEFEANMLAGAWLLAVAVILQVTVPVFMGVSKWSILQALATCTGVLLAAIGAHLWLLSGAKKNYIGFRRAMLSLWLGSLVVSDEPAKTAC